MKDAISVTLREYISRLEFSIMLPRSFAYFFQHSTNLAIAVIPNEEFGAVAILAYCDNLLPKSGLSEILVLSFGYGQSWFNCWICRFIVTWRRVVFRNLMQDPLFWAFSFEVTPKSR
jgi:hypothetical protein